MPDMRPLRAAFSTSRIPLAIVDDERRCIDANAAALLHLRTTIDELRGREIGDFVAHSRHEELLDVAPSRHLCAWLPAAAGSGDPSVPVSDREREVLLLVARGATVEDIASRLVISPNTV